MKNINIALTLKQSLYAACVITLSACSSIKEKPSDGHHPNKEDTTQAQAMNESSFQNTQRNQGKPLWIWIAPEYRRDLPEGTGEYLIETI